MTWRSYWFTELLNRTLGAPWTQWLNATHSARNLGFIFDEHFTFSDQISSLSKSCYSYILQLRCIRPYLDSKTASTIAASIVHSKLHYCNSHYYNLPKSLITDSSRFRTVLHIQWLKLLNLLLSHPSSHLCTGSRSTNALNINAYHSSTKFS